MEEEKKKRKNKKKKNKQTKGIENNAIGAEESASSNQNHPAEIRGSEAHTDDTSGIDDDPNRHDTDSAKVSSLAENEKHHRMDTEGQAIFEEKIKQLQKDKVAYVQNEAIFEEKLKQLSREKDASLLKEASFEEKIMQLQKEISSLRRQEANQEEKIRELHMEKDVYLQKEAEFEMKNSQLQSEKNSWLQKEAGLEKINNKLVDEVEKLNSKRVGLEERISFLVGEVENLNSMRVSLEEKVEEMEKERENWVQKEKSFREIISSLSGDNALLEAQVKEFEELRTNIVQENQLLKADIQVLQTQVYNLEKSAGPPYSPTGRKMGFYSVILAHGAITMTMEEHVGNLKTSEIRKLQSQKNALPRREGNLVLKATQDEDLAIGNSSTDDEDDEDEDNNQSLLAKEEESKKTLTLREKILTLMANFDSKTEEDIGRFILINDKLIEEHTTLQLVHKNIESEVDILKSQVLTLWNEKAGLEIEKLLAALTKGKYHANDAPKELKNMIKSVKTDLCDQYDKNNVLQEELKRVKDGLRRAYRWAMA
ncbi:hypothetical protein HAX54_023385 [Datura stramonium]|uniref:Uncharacterized protein n=1 Tax=Datura stramonium TaxID=4076 RepID=A0ABS8UYK1_DATST|nr:hypothetical protein [Datura stramonium]